jgi:predicted nucleic acid-binding Zn ribbon protein
MTEEECRKILEKSRKRQERAFRTTLFITKNAKTIIIIGWAISIFFFILFILETAGVFR